MDLQVKGSILGHILLLLVWLRQILERMVSASEVASGESADRFSMMRLSMLCVVKYPRN